MTVGNGNGRLDEAPVLQLVDERQPVTASGR